MTTVCDSAQRQLVGGWVETSETSADPLKFAARFNSMVRGAYRTMTAADIRALTNCGLIGRHGFYERDDVETVRGLLQYELARDVIVMPHTGESGENPITGESAPALHGRPEGRRESRPRLKGERSRKASGSRSCKRI
jgi:hypothetical protein